MAPEKATHPPQDTPQSAPIRVLIVDDHGVVRAGLRLFLSGTADLEVVGEASTGREAIAQAEALHPEVILMDLVMGEVNGIEATRQIATDRDRSSNATPTSPLWRSPALWTRAK